MISVMPPRLGGAVLAAALWTAAAPAQRLDGLEQASLLARVRKNAVEYSQLLPDFVCTQIIRRSISCDRQPWTDTDTLRLEIAFFNQRESYKLISHSGSDNGQGYDSIYGARSKGEFGSSLRLIFDPESAAVFEYAGPRRIGRHPVQDFRYRIPEERSAFALQAGSQAVHVAYAGEVSVDPASGRVFRISERALPPAGFSIRESLMVIDYGFRKVGEIEYLLPVRAEMTACQSAYGKRPPNTTPREIVIRYRNEVEFRDYRRFSIDTNVQFDLSP